MSGFDLPTFLFILLGLVPLAAFVLYPVFVWAFSRVRIPLSEPSEPESWPLVSLIVSAYNEEKIIQEKIENALALEYPRDRLQILIPTDGSTDGTDAIVNEYRSRNVVLLTSLRNRGKTVALNEAVDRARGSILVFSDANSLYEPLALKKLVRWMTNPAVGCVCGRLIYTNHNGSSTEEGEKRYWDWDTRIKRWEGASGHLVGANGAIFALRKSLTVELPGDQSNDMVLPIVARLRGFRAVYEPKSVAVESTAQSVRGEFRRKIRIIARGINGVVYSLHCAFQDSQAREAPMAGRLFLLFQLFCKKFCRYLTFPAVGGMMVLGPFLPLVWARHLSGALWVALVFTGIVTLVRPVLSPFLRRWPNFTYPLAMAVAACAGFLLFLSGRDVSRWRSQR